MYGNISIKFPPATKKRQSAQSASLMLGALMHLRYDMLIWWLRLLIITSPVFGILLFVRTGKFEDRLRSSVMTDVEPRFREALRP